MVMSTNSSSSFRLSPIVVTLSPIRRQGMFGTNRSPPIKNHNDSVAIDEANPIFFRPNSKIWILQIFDKGTDLS